MKQQPRMYTYMNKREKKKLPQGLVISWNTPIKNIHGKT